MPRPIQDLFGKVGRSESRAEIRGHLGNVVSHAGNTEEFQRNDAVEVFLSFFVYCVVGVEKPRALLQGIVELFGVQFSEPKKRVDRGEDKIVEVLWATDLGVFGLRQTHGRIKVISQFWAIQDVVLDGIDPWIHEIVISATTNLARLLKKTGRDLTQEADSGLVSATDSQRERGDPITRVALRSWGYGIKCPCPLVDVSFDGGIGISGTHHKDGFRGLHPGSPEPPSADLVNVRVPSQGDLSLEPDAVEMAPQHEGGSNHLLYYLPSLKFVCIQVFPDSEILPNNQGVNLLLTIGFIDFLL